MKKSKIAICQNMSDQINNGDGTLLACPGVDRIGVIDKTTQNQNEITVIDSNHPNQEWHIYPFYNGGYILCSDDKQDLPKQIEAALN